MKKITEASEAAAGLRAGLDELSLGLTRLQDLCERLEVPARLPEGRKPWPRVAEIHGALELALKDHLLPATASLRRELEADADSIAARGMESIERASAKATEVAEGGW